MITSVGNYQLKEFRVSTNKIEDGLHDPTMLGMLRTRPEGQPLVFRSAARAA